METPDMFHNASNDLEIKENYAMSLYVVSFKHFVKCIIWNVSENNLILGRDLIPLCNKPSKT